MGDPETANVGPAGLARYSSLRSWLSQWSVDDSRADAPTGAGRRPRQASSGTSSPTARISARALLRVITPGRMR